MRHELADLGFETVADVEAIVQHLHVRETSTPLHQIVKCVEFASKESLNASSIMSIIGLKDAQSVVVDQRMGKKGRSDHAPTVSEV